LGNIQSPFDRFRQSGQFAERDPTLLFDTDYYLKENPDVQAAVMAGQFTAMGHFGEFGQLEGRNPVRYLTRNSIWNKIRDLQAEFVGNPSRLFAIRQ
jgi:hypothetical protein